MKDATLHGIVKRGRDNLTRNHWDYLVGGADSETSLRRNRHGLDSLAYRPRILADVSHVHVAGELLGIPLRIPVALAPIGSLQVFEADGGTSAARAAADFGVVQILSSVCLPDFEAVAADVPGPRIYQLYLMGDQLWMDDIIERAVLAGYTGLCLTADTQTYSRRERDILKGFVPPSGSRAGAADFSYQARMTWETVAHIKARFDIPLVVKGVAAAEDAARCVDAGVDAVYVSNHGGRQLDHTRACIDALPEVVEAVDGRVPVIVDGGFMRGADVVKALCLGATAVGLGRLQALALAAGGAPTLFRALEILEHEIRTTVALLGMSDIGRLHPGLLAPAVPVNAPTVLSAFPLLDEDY
ncbi:MAG: alpha-hydroxy acid oxidase [Gammaproteobacteria bacterium]|nr:alpha-hydroxy acid oxidase [Gammaproteobacteria bacterium]